MSLSLQSLPDRRIEAVYGAALLLFLQLFAALSLHIGSVRGALIGIPIIAILLWPRRAEPILSIIFIFASGLLTDAYYGLPRGGSSLLYLLVYGLARPKNIIVRTSFLTYWVRCIGVTLIILCVLIILSWRLSSYIMMVTVLTQAVFVVVIFPLVYTVRRGVRLFFVDADRR